MRMPAGEYLYNPIGSVHGGALATLLDSVMGCAVHSTLPAGRGYTTLEIKVNYLRAVTEVSGCVTATGRVVHAGRRQAVAEASLADEAGRLCATASTTCLVFDLPTSRRSAPEPALPHRPHRRRRPRAALARHLTAEGLRVGLAARDTDKLADLAAETGAGTFAADAADPRGGRAAVRRGRCPDR